jgi:peptidoglycan/xylan/chitin deacetylase (PgdA/CDA1 family)
MSGDPEGGHEERSAPMTKAELSERRADWRRHRRNVRTTRRALALLTVAVVAAIGVLLVAGGSSGTGPEASAPLRTNPATRHATRQAKPSRPLHRGPSQPASPSAARAQQAAVARVLRYTSYVRLAGAREREVALTFDDGPSTYTPQVLGVLERMYAPATFFVIGREAQTYPKFVAAEARDGFEVGDHTQTHPLMAALSPAVQQSQISDAASAIHAAGAPYPRLWRPPYGSFNAATLRTLHHLGMLMVLWSVDTSDYARPGVARIVYTAVSGARPGAIILMHDGGGPRSETVAALPRIITRLRQRHFKLVTVAQLVADDPPPASQPAPTPLAGVG